MTPRAPGAPQATRPVPTTHEHERRAPPPVVVHRERYTTVSLPGAARGSAQAHSPGGALTLLGNHVGHALGSFDCDIRHSVRTRRAPATTAHAPSRAPRHIGALETDSRPLSFPRLRAYLSPPKIHNSPHLHTMAISRPPPLTAAGVVPHASLCARSANSPSDIEVVTALLAVHSAGSDAPWRPQIIDGRAQYAQTVEHDRLQDAPADR